LITLATLTDPADGAFGPHTEEALRRFQWYVAHLRFRLKLLPGSTPATGTIEEASKAGVVLHLNQTFRREGVPPAGAVVPPATRSQHLVSHAADLNIVDGSTINTNATFPTRPLRSIRQECVMP